MTTNNKTVRIFTMQQEFPCGPQSSCCGPVGQTEDEIENIRETIEKELNCQVEVLNVTDGSQMKNHLPVVRLVRSFGPKALPIITLDDEVVSMGSPTPDEAISAIKEKIKG